MVSCDYGQPQHLMVPTERLLVEKELYLAVLSSDRLVQVLLVMKTK